MRQTLAILEKGSAMPKCVFAVRWEEGFAARYPHLASLRKASKLVALQAVWLSRRGRSDEAMHWLTVGLRMARHAGADPIIIAQLVQDAMCAIMLRPAREVLGTGKTTAAARRELAVAVMQIDVSGSLAKAVQGEIAQGLQVFGDLRWGARANPLLGKAFLDGPVLPMWAVYRSWLGAVWRNQDECAYVDAAQEAQRLAALRTWKAQQIAPGLRGPTPGKWSAPLTSMHLPTFFRACEERDEAQADLDLCRIVLALQDYRASHGQYPADLAALPPASPALHLTDPFSGKPYVYARDGKGFLVYSIGKDMVDDGGVPNYDAQGSFREKGDIVWRGGR